LALGIVGFTAVWILTSPSCLLFINWDNAAYLADFGRGIGWNHRPWNVHFAIGHLYLALSWPVRAFGGGLIDGFRFTNALFVGGTTALFADTALRLARSRALAVLVPLAWLSLWGTLYLVATLEDNLLYLLPALGALRVTVLRVDRWHPRDSVLAGTLGGLAMLAATQAAMYVAPAVWAAIIGGSRGRSVGTRARDVALVLMACVAAMCAWTLLLAPTVSWFRLGDLLRIQFSTPQPNMFPKSGTELWWLLSDVGAMLRTVGVGVQLTLWPLGRGAPLPPPSLRTPLPEGVLALGLVAVMVEVALFAWLTLGAVRSGRRAGHLLAATLLLFTVAAGLYQERPWFWEIKRYDFLAPVGLVLAAWLLGEARPERRRTTERAATLALSVVVVVDIAVFASYRSHYGTTLPETEASWVAGEHPPPAWYGREGLPWFGYFRRIRSEHPEACAYVFSVRELTECTWNHDITASLYNELPRYQLLAQPWERPAQTRFPLRYTTPRAVRRDCAWLSDDARRLVGR
jgi:hypothetical protein